MLLLIFVYDCVGVLLEIFVLFVKYNISLISIEMCFVLFEKWVYVFFIDLEGYVE